MDLDPTVPLGKPCTKCKTSKPLSHFYPCKKGKWGTTSQCRECMIAASAARRIADPERQRMYARSSAEKSRKRAEERAAAGDQQAELARRKAIRDRRRGTLRWEEFRRNKEDEAFGRWLEATGQDD